MWYASANVTTVGTATGKILNEWFEEAVLWAQLHPGYSLFSVWDRPEVEKHTAYVEDSICDSFTEWGLKVLYKLGSKFAVEGALCRNYFPFISNASPRELDLSSSADMDTVTNFYGTIQSLMLKGRIFRDLAEFGAAFLKALRMLYTPEAVLFQRGPDNSTGVCLGSSRYPRCLFKMLRAALKRRH